MPPEEIEPLFAELPPAPVPAREPAAAVAWSAQEPPAPHRERRAFGLADANVRRRFAGANQPPPPDQAASAVREQPAMPIAASRPAEPNPTAATPPGEPVDLASLADLLRELEIRPSMTGRRLPPGASEQWTEIPITSRVYLSVRGLSAEDSPLADAVARAMKKLLRVR
jgi:hypothetical protein